jgi:peptidoglycan/LPS O-acetylase OafA/YrhL
MMLCLASLGGSLLIRLGLVLTGNELAAYVLTPARMDTLGVGAFLALAARGPHGLARFRRWAGPVAAGAAMAFVAILWIEMPPPYQSLLVTTVGYTVLACLFGALLILAVISAPEATMGRIFGHPSLTFFGRYSYALYIFHLPVAFFVKRHLFSVRALPTLLRSQLPGQLGFFLVATSVSVGLALLSWHWYEKHFLKLKERFPYQYQVVPTCVSLDSTSG